MATPGWQPIVLPKMTPSDFPLVIDFSSDTTWPDYWFEGERRPGTGDINLRVWHASTLPAEHDPINGTIGYDRAGTATTSPYTNIWQRRVVAHDIYSEWGDPPELSYVIKFRYYKPLSLSSNHEFAFGLGRTVGTGSLLGTSFGINGGFRRIDNPDTFSIVAPNVGTIYPSATTLPVPDQWLYAACSYQSAGGSGSDAIGNGSFAMQGEAMNTISSSTLSSDAFYIPPTVGLSGTNYSDWLLYAAFPREMEVAYIKMSLAYESSAAQEAQLAALGWS